MSQLDVKEETHLPLKPKTLSALTHEEKRKTRILWAGNIPSLLTPPELSAQAVAAAAAAASANPATAGAPILFHSLRAETRAQVYATDLLLPHAEDYDAEEERKLNDQAQAGEGVVYKSIERIYEIAAEISDLEVSHMVHSAVQDIASDVANDVVDFLDRKIVWLAEKTLGKLSEKFDELSVKLSHKDAEVKILYDANRVMEILVLAEKIWFLLRGDPVPISMMNVSQTALRFHAVLFQNESIGKLRLLLSEALAIDAEHLHLELRSSRASVLDLRVEVDEDNTKLWEFLSKHNTSETHRPLQFRFSTTREKEIFFRTDHFMDDPEVRQLKGKVVEILEEIFYTHAPNPMLQEANRSLLCLASKYSSDENPLKKFTSSKTFDKNLFGLIFSMSSQRSTLDLDRLTQHILSCGISPLSTSASRDRVLNLMRYYGQKLSDSNPEAYEMDLSGFIRFYTDAFLERPMLSWYDYLAYGYSHEFERDPRIVPLCLSLQSVSKNSRIRYEEYRIQDYLQNNENKFEGEALSEPNDRAEDDDDKFWATNRVEFTCRGVVERPQVLRILERANVLLGESAASTTKKVLDWRAKNRAVQGQSYSSGKVAPIAALYL